MGKQNDPAREAQQDGAGTCSTEEKRRLLVLLKRLLLLEKLLQKPS